MAKKRIKKSAGVKKPARANRSGICRLCGCREDAPCRFVCAWVEGTRRTLCTQCDDAETRVTAAWARAAERMPVYGLWVIDGGPNARGHWLVEVAGDGATQHPAVFFDLKSATWACRREMTAGLGRDGWTCVVVELRAVNAGSLRR